MKKLYGMRYYDSKDSIRLYFLTEEEAAAMREAFYQIDQNDNESLVLLDTAYSIIRGKIIATPTSIENDLIENDL